MRRSKLGKMSPSTTNRPTPPISWRRRRPPKEIVMRITQGAFSFLPDLADSEIRAQIDYALAQGWAIGVEYTDDPHPRNFYWGMWGNPMFDLRDAAGVMTEIAACRKSFPDIYIRVIAFDATRGFETTRLSFIVNR